jgi:hypothetical protein
MRKKHSWPQFKTDAEYISWLQEQAKSKKETMNGIRERYLSMVRQDDQYRALGTELLDISKTLHYLRYVKGKRRNRYEVEPITREIHIEDSIIHTAAPHQEVEEPSIIAIPDDKPIFEITADDIEDIRRDMSVKSSCRDCDYKDTMLCNVCNGHDKDEILKNDVHIREIVEQQIRTRVDLPG